MSQKAKSVFVHDDGPCRGEDNILQDNVPLDEYGLFVKHVIKNMTLDNKLPQFMKKSENLEIANEFTLLIRPFIQNKLNLKMDEEELQTVMTHILNREFTLVEL